MVAAVERMVYFGQTPWHKLGTPIKEGDRFDIEKGLKVSGLDWNVELVPLFTKDGKSVAEFAQAVRRKTDSKILGTVGPRYTPLQNRVAFEWFKPMFDNKLCALNTAGSLFGGQKVWILSEILGKGNIEIAKNDECGRFLMISNSHDGSSSVRVGFTFVRIVCANTLAMAHSSASSKLLRLRHNKSVVENLEAVRDIINLANQEFEATAEQYKFLVSRKINASDLRKYVRKVVGVKDDVLDNDIPTRTQNTMTEILNRMLNGIGNDNAAIKGTWYQAYMGVNEWLNYSRGNKVDNRMDKLWFASGINDNLKALDLALEFAQAA